MSMVPIILLAALVFVVGAWGLRLPRAGWGLFGAALLLGLAGYAWQGSAGYAGAPGIVSESKADDGAAMVETRRAMAGIEVSPGNFVVIADGYARRGDYRTAAQILQGAISQEPDNGDAWLALANALVGAADGALTPPALYAYEKAGALMPDSPAPDYFLGAAYVRGGQLAPAQTAWATALAKTPPDAPWHDGLALRLNQLNGLMAQLSERQQ